MFFVVVCVDEVAMRRPKRRHTSAGVLRKKRASAAVPSTSKVEVLSSSCTTGLATGDAASKAEVEFDELTLVTLNVDGLGNYYATDPAARMDAILNEVLVVEPNVLVLQEMTIPMFTQLRRRLPEWKASHDHTAASSFANSFNVTLMRHGSEKTASVPLPASANGRHLVMARQSGWTIWNTQAESGSTAQDRDVRERQLHYMSRLHQLENTANFVF